MTARAFLGAALLAFAAGCSTSPTHSPTATPSVPAEALNPDVRQETIQQTICASGYAASVRPATSYTSGVKLKLLRERGLPEAAARDYELDHRVALALGGHPRNLKNLELQRWGGLDGAKQKDRLERRLQQLVCAGRVALQDAQQALYFDWQAASLRYLQSP